ncbi:MAG: hypothetical protein ACTS8P_00125, partial [Arsenophonus sp. NC-XBC3-MAG3]
MGLCNRVPEGQTVVNQYYYLEVLAHIHEKIKKDTNCGKTSHSSSGQCSGSHCLSCDISRHVKTFLAKHNIPVLDHPPNSSDLAPCDFYLFPKVKSALKEQDFRPLKL